MLDANGLGLYLCIGSEFLEGRSLKAILEEAIFGGVTMIQVREKTASSLEFYNITRAALEVTKARKVPLVVNDRLDIALAAGADGLHLGQSDLPLQTAKKIAGGKLFIGASAGTLEEALAAEKDGADYLGAGAVFPTGSKADAGNAIGLEQFGKICAAVHIPVIGIGGIGLQNAAEVMKSGAAGIAVISAILSQSNIKAAAQNLRQKQLNV